MRRQGMDRDPTVAPRHWRDRVPAGGRPYTESAPLAALFLGVSSGFPYAMIGATLTTRLAQDGIDKKTVTAFTLAFLVYNLKFLWAWVVDGVRLPVLGRLGQRVSWMIAAGLFVIAAVVNLALADPQASILWTAYAAILVGVVFTAIGVPCIALLRPPAFARAGRPLAGDLRYGKPKPARQFLEKFEVPTLLLHAQRLEIPDSVLGAPRAFEAPLPPAFLRLIERKGWKAP